MRIKSLTGIATAFALTASPIMAAPAFAAPSAQSLSLTQGARAAAPTKAKNQLGGGGVAIYAALIVAGIAAILIIDGTKDDSSASN